MEMSVRRALHKAGIRYRLHRRDLPGSPDLVLVRPRIALFISSRRSSSRSWRSRA
ncbi:MAG: hypothetical protein AAB387_08000 [candidate division NC10 bacterium]